MGAQRDIQIGQRRGLRLDDASTYVGFGKTKFLEMVGDGRMPKPKRVDGCVVWDRLRLDTAFDNLPDEDETNLADQACGFGSGMGNCA